MSLNEEFDELARQKLAERDFPYQEADWQAARALIDAQRGRRNRGAWFMAGGALLLLIGLAWLLSRHEMIDDSTIGNFHDGLARGFGSAQPNVSYYLADKRQLFKTDSITTSGPASTERHVSAERTRNTQSTEAVHTLGNEEATVARPSPASTPSTVVTGAGTGTSDAPGSVASHGAPPMRTPAKPSARTNVQKTGDVRGPSHHPTTVRAKTASVTTPSTAELAAAHPPTDNRVYDKPAATAESQAGTRAAAADHATPDASNPMEAQLQAATNMAPVAPTAAEGSGTITPADPFAAPAALQQKIHGTIAQDAGSPAGQPNSTASLAAAQAMPQDSASAAGLPAPPPIVPERAPWEISIMGGLFSTGSHYTGGASADWSAGLGRAQVAGLGAELMHIGRNIGIGIGIHYGNYAERIRTGALEATSTSLNHYWYLHPVTTTVLVITDTVPGVPPTYVGTSTSTMVNVLAQGTDTAVTTHRLREARDQENRVSYLEVPLLLDAHLVQGRWTLGVRGGPAIGLLTGRRGALPNPAGDGYLAFNDMAFRELTLGYTARAYLRYRFNAAWSVGVGPAVRGQMLNSFSGNGLQRRSTAVGALVDITYRLR